MKKKSQNLSYEFLYIFNVYILYDDWQSDGQNKLYAGCSELTGNLILILLCTKTRPKTPKIWGNIYKNSQKPAKR